jgi:hypothetical protein
MHLAGIRNSNPLTLMKKSLLLGATLVLACSFGGAAHAQLLNGNFASKPLTGSNYNNVAPGDSTNITDWTVDAGGPLTGDPNSDVQLIGPGFSGNAGFGTFTGGTGAQVVQLTYGPVTSPGGISQSFATVIGDSYTLTVDISARSGGNATGNLYFGNSSGTGSSEALDATTEAFATSTPLTFVATSLTSLVDITAISNSAMGAEPLVIANVVLTQNIVPEPSTYLMMGVGLLGLVVLRRFRRFAA